jgi:hypothetical protein
MVSLIAPHGSQAVLAVAEDLDAKIVHMLEAVPRQSEDET